MGELRQTRLRRHPILVVTTEHRDRGHCNRREDDPERQGVRHSLHDSVVHKDCGRTGHGTRAESYRGGHLTLRGHVGLMIPKTGEIFESSVLIVSVLESSFMPKARFVHITVHGPGNSSRAMVKPTVRSRILFLVPSSLRSPQTWRLHYNDITL